VSRRCGSVSSHIVWWGKSTTSRQGYELISTPSPSTSPSTPTVTCLVPPAGIHTSASVSVTSTPLLRMAVATV